MKYVNITNTPIVPDAQIVVPALPRTNNIIEIVVTKKIREEKAKAAALAHRAELIRVTEKLAADAKSGALQGLGGFAEYDDESYMLGLEGSYLMNPESAILPVRRLERRIMDQIIEQED